jgi:hypothetical protein
MARDIQIIDRQIGEPSANLIAPTAFTALGESAANISRVFQNAAQQATNEATRIAAENAALTNNAPKNLGPAVGQASSIYNKAVSETEARQLLLMQRDEALNLYQRLSDPRNFNNETPEIFQEKLQEINSNILQKSRPSNRAAVEAGIQQISNSLSQNMLGNAIKYDNSILLQNLNTEISQLTEQRQTALILGNDDDVKFLDEQIKKTLKDYSIISQQVKDMLPQLESDIVKKQKVDNVIKDFVKAADNKEQAQFMIDFLAKGPGDELSFSEWKQAASEMLKMNQLQASLANAARGEQIATVEQLIESNEITTFEQIQDYDLLQPIDVIKLNTKLNHQLTTAQKKITNIKEDQINFALGRGGAIPAARINEYFNAQIQRFQQDNETIPSLKDMADMVAGVGPYSITGIEGLAPNRDVPKFNDIITGMLEGNNPVQISDAAAIYYYLTQTLNKPNSINLSGDALKIAIGASNRMIGNNTLPLEVAATVSNRVLNKDLPIIKEASIKFNKNISKDIPKKFKKLFDAPAEGFSNNEALGIFRDTYYDAYLSSGSEDDAQQYVEKLMSNWGVDKKYGIKGLVQKNPLNKEFAADDIGYAISNQLMFALQKIVDRNPNINWANKEDGIKNVDEVFNKLTEKERVYISFKDKALSPTEFLTTTGTTYPTTAAGVTEKIIDLIKSKDFVLKIDGRDRKVFPLSNATTNLSGDGKYTYTFYYLDDYNSLQPVPDAQNGFASFTPMRLSEYAPNIFNEKSEEIARQQALQYQQNEFQDLLKEHQLEKGQNIPDFINKYAASIINIIQNENGKGPLEGETKKFFEALKEQMKKTGKLVEIEKK